MAFDIDLPDLRVRHGARVRLKSIDTDATGPYESKEAAEKHLRKGIQELRRLQEMLYAQDQQALLLIFQAMDGAGKDSTIEHVMSGVNPQGCQVFSFKAPSAEEVLALDVARFAAEILKIARSESRGVPGARKAYIADVWKRLAPAGTPSPDAEARFKTMLIEAHRMGLLSLTNADLRDKANMSHVQASAVSYQNTVWHLIRVEDV